MPTKEGSDQRNPLRDHFRFVTGAGRVAQCGLIEYPPDPDGSDSSDTRRFIVIDDNAGHGLAEITLGHIHGEGQDGQAEVAIRDITLAPSQRLEALPMDKVLRKTMVASGVSTGYLDVEATTVGPTVLEHANFRPTQELGVYAVAA